MWNPFTSKKELVATKEESGGFMTVVSSLFDDFFPSNTLKSPLSLVPVYAAIKILSQTIAIADLKMYQKTNKGRKELSDHKLNKLFKQPFMEMTNFNWMQMMMLQLAGYGNAYALIVRNSDYSVRELIPLEYDMVSVYKDSGSNVYYYQVMHNAKSFKVFPENMLHYKIFSRDGIRGLSPIELHRSTLDSLYNESEYLSSFYEKAANLSGTIESEGVTAKQINSIKESFQNKYGASNKSGQTLILPNGMKYKQLKLLSPMDANYIETAKLNRGDVAVIWGIPLSLLGDLSQATYSNLSELNRAFYKMTIAPYFVAIAQENNLKLLNESEKAKTYFEFDPEHLLSASKKERYDTYAVGIDSGIITRNEVRELENLESIDGLDEIMQKSGTLTVSQADKQFVKGVQDGNGNNSNDTSSSSDTTNNANNESATLKKELNDVKAKLGRIEALQTAHVKTPKKEMK